MDPTILKSGIKKPLLLKQAFKTRLCFSLSKSFLSELDLLPAFSGDLISRLKISRQNEPHIISLSET